MIRRARSSLVDSCIVEIMPKPYACLKMNKADIISKIQALPAEQEDRAWALEMGTSEGKEVRYSKAVTPLWEILENITALHQLGEMPFVYAGILRLPNGSSYSITFNGQQIFPFGDLNQIKDALEIEKKNQQAIARLRGEEKEYDIEIWD